MKKRIEILINPFIRIAGTQALLWGALGLVVSTLLSWLSVIIIMDYYTSDLLPIPLGGVIGQSI